MLFLLVELNTRGRFDAVFLLMQHKIFSKMYLADRLIASITVCLDMLDADGKNNTKNNKGNNTNTNTNNAKYAGLNTSAHSLSLMGLIVGSFYRSLSILSSMLTHAVNNGSEQNIVPDSFDHSWYKKIVQLVYVYMEKYCSKYASDSTGDSTGAGDGDILQASLECGCDSMSAALYRLGNVPVSSKKGVTVGVTMGVGMVHVAALRTALALCVGVIDSMDFYIAATTGASGVSGTGTGTGTGTVSTLGCITGAGLLYSSTGQKHLSTFKYLVSTLNVERSLQLTHILSRACLLPGDAEMNTGYTHTVVGRCMQVASNSNSNSIILTVLKSVWESVTDKSAYGVDLMSIVGHFVGQDGDADTIQHPALSPAEGLCLSLDILSTLGGLLGMLS